MSTAYMRVARAVMASAVYFAVGTAANAATVVGVWDPQFGGNNGTLGWNGTAEFFLPDNCLSGAGTVEGSVFVNNDNNFTTGCGMRLTSATVRLYDPAWAPYDPNNPLTFDTLTFGATDFVGTIYGMEVKSIGGINAVVGIDSPIFSTSGCGLIYCGPFDMWWEKGAVDPVFGQTYYNCDGDGYCTDVGQQSDPVVPRSLTTCYENEVCVTVPEPGTMGLVFGALGAGWFARRRKKTV
jgi:hypothetical protein